MRLPNGRGDGEIRLSGHGTSEPRPEDGSCAIPYCAKTQLSATRLGSGRSRRLWGWDDLLDQPLPVPGLDHVAGLQEVARVTHRAPVPPG